MSGQVNPVDSVKVSTATPATPPARTVEPEEEQMFEFSGASALETGYNIVKEVAGYTTIGALHKIIDDESMLPERTKGIVPEFVKEFIHEQAEEIRKYDENHGPVSSWFMTGGILGKAITWLDEQINN